jgi:hypothetical protein
MRINTFSRKNNRDNKQLELIAKFQRKSSLMPLTSFILMRTGMFINADKPECIWNSYEIESTKVKNVRPFFEILRPPIASPHLNLSSKHSM